MIDQNSINIVARYKCATAGTIIATHQIDLATGKDQRGAVVGGIPNRILTAQDTNWLVTRRAQLLIEARALYSEITRSPRWRRGDISPWLNKIKNESQRIDSILNARGDGGVR